MRTTGILRGAASVTGILLLAGCLKSMSPGATAPEPEEVSRFGSSDVAAEQSESGSDLIAALSARGSVIEPGSAYARIAEAAMASDARVADAELRVAELREKAASRNWMPTIGPSVSLTSLGDLVTDIVLNQVLFDNGRRKAERALARAEVELAAVQLVEDGNARVRDALALYLKMREGREAALHFAQAHAEMSEFERVMQARVSGGVANPSDLTVLRQKLADIAADRDRAREDAATAEAELVSLNGGALPDVSSLGAFTAGQAARPLSIHKAEATRDRVLAEADILRAGHLPGLGASVTSDGRRTRGALRLDTEAGLGLGTGASLEAIEASRVAAERSVTEARDTADREVAALRRDAAALSRQADEAGALVGQAKANLDLFKRQYEGGGRKMMEVVGVYESYADAVETALTLKYRAARAAVAAAHREGTLVGGADL